MNEKSEVETGQVEAEQAKQADTAPEIPEGSDFSEFMDDDEFNYDFAGEESESPQETPRQTSEEEAAPVEAEKAEPETESPKEESLKGETPEEAATPEPVAEQEAQKPAETQQQEEVDSTEYRENLMNTLEKGLYNLSEEESNLLVSEPEKVLPRLAAKVHTEVLEAAMRGIMSYMPQMVESALQGREARTQSENKFYSRWEKLRGHEDTVQKIAQVYRQLNPNATEDQAIEAVGLQAMVSLGLPFEEDVKEEAPAPAPPAKPVAPGATRTPPPAPSKPSNPFAQLAEEFMQEE